MKSFQEYREGSITLAKFENIVYIQECLVYVNCNISTQVHSICLSHVSVLFTNASLLKPIFF